MSILNLNAGIASLVSDCLADGRIAVPSTTTTRGPAGQVDSQVLSSRKPLLEVAVVGKCLLVDTTMELSLFLVSLSIIVSSSLLF